MATANCRIGTAAGKIENRIPDTLRNRVSWTGFIDDPADLAALYQSTEVLAIPSDYEPWGVVVTEAVAAGLAVVASSVVGAAADVVQDGVNGRIFRKGDGKHLAECLLDITDEANIGRMRAGSRKMLARWRAASDPVRGLRMALACAGLPIEAAVEQESVA